MVDGRKENGELVAGQPGQDRAFSLAVADFSGDHDPQSVGDHDQQLVAACMPKAVVNVLEAIEVDEQHRGERVGRAAGKQFVGLGPEMEPVGKRRYRVIHAERMGIFDRRAHFGEQAVDRGGELGHGVAHDPRRGAGKIALFDRQQPIAEGVERTRAFAVGPFGGDVADQQAEHARHDRCHEFFIEAGDVEKGGQREQERGKARGPGQDRVADFLRRTFLDGGNRPALFAPCLRHQVELNSLG